MTQERISRGAGYALAARAVSATLTAVLTIFLGRTLTEASYGHLTFAVGVAGLASLFAQFGVAGSAGRFIAERRDRPERMSAVLATALRVQAPLAGGASLALFLLAPPLCDAFNAPSATLPVRLLAVALFGESVFLLVRGAFVAAGKIRYNVLLATVESVVEATFSVLLVVAGLGAAGAALGIAAGYIAGVLVAIPVAARRIGPLRGRQERQEVSAREMVSYAGPLLFVDVAFRLFSTVDVMLIALLVGGGSAVASFGIPMRLAAFLDYPAGALGAAVAPRMAKRQDGQSGVQSLARSLRYLLIIQMLMTAPLVVWPSAIMHLLFGAKYPEAASVLRGLTPYVFLSGIAEIVTIAVNYLGEARRRIPLAVAMLSVNAVIDAILLPRIGILGAAIGTSAAYALWVPAHLVILRKRTELRLRPLAVTCGRVVIAGAAMAGVLAMLGTGVQPLGVMLLGAVIGPLTYGIVLLATREVGRGDFEVLRAVAARRVGVRA